jgi:prepilin-type N-terminal cleavage/methylation domain-containing protein
MTSRTTTSSAACGSHRIARLPGFTLIELLVSIAIIALLITLVTVGVSHVSKIARGTSERQTVVQLNQAVQAFKQEFGFLPPLVTEKETAPIIRPVELVTGGIAINSYGGTVTATAKSFNTNPVFLEGFSNGDPASAGTKMMSADWAAGSTGATETTPDYRFSEYSLAYFLVGALGRGIDGVDGPGMFKPKADGTFEFGIRSSSSRVNKVQGRSYPAFVDTSRRSPKLESDLIASTSDSDLRTTDPNTGAQVAENVRVRLISPSGKAYRYYRWAPRQKGPTGMSSYFNPKSPTFAFNRPEEGADLLNVPSLLGDPRENAELRGAEYAIVSTGADGYFGDMNLEATSDELLREMATKVKAKIDADAAANSIAVRKAARADNVVEVGR